jgi:hypothetical protein
MKKALLAAMAAAFILYGFTVWAAEKELAGAVWENKRDGPDI